VVSEEGAGFFREGSGIKAKDLCHGFMPSRADAIEQQLSLINQGLKAQRAGVSINRRGQGLERSELIGRDQLFQSFS